MDLSGIVLFGKFSTKKQKAFEETQSDREKNIQTLKKKNKLFERKECELRSRENSVVDIDVILEELEEM